MYERLPASDLDGRHERPQSLWPPDPKPRRIHFLETESPVSLRDLLLSSAKMGPREKRETSSNSWSLGSLE